MSQKTCKELIKEKLARRIEELSELWLDYQDGGDSPQDFGLSFDYEPSDGRTRGYFCWQLSNGGPSDEFRFYAEGTGTNWVIERVEYVYKDWFDGAKRTLSANNRDLLDEIFQAVFVETETAELKFHKAYSG